MSFQLFTAMGRGRKSPTDSITIRKHHINLGQNDIPYKYLKIEYDTDNLSIRFSKGNKNNGYYAERVNDRRVIRCESFIKKGLLPFGKYVKIGELTYRYHIQGIRIPALKATYEGGKK